MNYRLIDIVNSISCFQLAVFSFFLIHKGRKNLSNIVLALFFITQFIVIGITIYWKWNLFISAVPLWFLFGPLMNFYIKSLVKKDFKFRLIDSVHLLPFILGFIFIISQYHCLNDEAKQTALNNGQIFRQLTIASILQNIQVLIYNACSLFILFNYQKDLKNYCSIVEKRNLIWLKIVLYGYLVPCIIAETNSFAGNLIPVSEENRMFIIYISFLIFFNILFYKAMLHPYVIFQSEYKPKQTGSSLDKIEIQNYAKNIEAFFISEKIYLNQTLTLRDLSEATGISERNLSQVINNHWKQNFYSFVNSFRIKEAKTLLMFADLNKETMEGISFDSGFNSKSAFYEAFKKHTGMTPKEYRKLKA